MTRRYLTQQQVDFILEKVEAGWNQRRIAAAVPCSVSTVYWQALKNGADRPNPPKLRPTGPAVVKRGDHFVRRFTPEDDARLLALEAGGATDTEIARALGRRANSIRGRMATLARMEARAEGAST